MPCNSYGDCNNLHGTFRDEVSTNHLIKTRFNNLQLHMVVIKPKTTISLVHLFCRSFISNV
jgi:hypothetical protein